MLKVPHVLETEGLSAPLVVGVVASAISGWLAITSFLRLRQEAQTYGVFALVPHRARRSSYCHCLQPLTRTRSRRRRVRRRSRRRARAARSALPRVVAVRRRSDRRSTSRTSSRPTARRRARWSSPTRRPRGAGAWGARGARSPARDSGSRSSSDPPTRARSTCCRCASGSRWRRALDAFAGAPVRLKWPNDLYVGRPQARRHSVEARWRDGTSGVGRDRRRRQRAARRRASRAPSGSSAACRASTCWRRSCRRCARQRRRAGRSTAAELDAVRRARSRARAALRRRRSRDAWPGIDASGALLVDVGSPTRRPRIVRGRLTRSPEDASMILVFDVGNTEMTIGLFSEAELRGALAHHDRRRAHGRRIRRAASRRCSPARGLRAGRRRRAWRSARSCRA